ncbi:MAG: hypothetical protein ED556_10590 [Winogradskyella sp.]|uniref:hypothetical protein n=1 Tax=Winogradskyella sp. TaxID=1883156 RepID=UPI000F3E4AA5|nr:hypothetical protein [Winogradskyella sp.]RNC85009.1 MAG: hypothetical protein ED556_10590 [Winogradskyella sp.]
MGHIISKRPKLIILHNKLPDLTANDIIKATIFKGIKSNFIVLSDTSRKHYKSSFLNKIKYIDLNNKDFIHNLIEALNSIKLEVISDT